VPTPLRDGPQVSCAPPSDFGGEHRTEAVPPQPHGFMADIDLRSNRWGIRFPLGRGRSGALPVAAAGSRLGADPALSEENPMGVYVGLDVSLASVAICVIDEDGASCGRARRPAIRKPCA
jgi:hypothetical protein